MTNPVLTENDSKHARRRFSNRFSETVITSAVLTENDGIRILHEKRRFSNIFSERVMTNAVLTENDAKRILDKKVRVSVLVRHAHFTG